MADKSPIGGKLILITQAHALVKLLELYSYNYPIFKGCKLNLNNSP